MSADNNFKMPQERSDFTKTPEKPAQEIQSPAEVLVSREKSEARPEAPREAESSEKSPRTATIAPVPTVASSLGASLKSEILIQVEDILEQDLGDIYFKMDFKDQQKFKTKGEETAQKIETIMSSGRIKAQQIFKLLIEWLKTIPGVNKFFIRQAAKIKTDKILNLKK